MNPDPMGFDLVQEDARARGRVERVLSDAESLAKGSVKVVKDPETHD